MGRFLQYRIRSFRYAFAGLFYMIRTQRNAWIHAVAAVLVILLAAWLQLQARDWAVLILAIGLVWMGEMINTALEAVVDLASPDDHQLAKIAKDVGAAAVLVAAMSAAIIGFLVLGPPLLAKLIAR